MSKPNGSVSAHPHELEPAPPWRLVACRLHYVLGVSYVTAHRMAYRHRDAIAKALETGTCAEITRTVLRIECVE